MQLQIGSFRFEAAAGAETTVQEIARGRQWVRRARFGRPPALEDRGRTAAELTLRGTIPILSSADLTALDILRAEGGLVDAGSEAQPLPLFSPGPLPLFRATAAGMEALGTWTVERLTERRRGLRTAAGIPTVIEFTVSLVEAVP